VLDPSTAPPRAAVVLGWLGVLPFLFFAASSALNGHVIGGADWWRAYGAIILSFMGGAQWGLAVAPNGSAARLRRFSISVLPALVGWLSLAVQPRPAVALQLAGFAALLAYDLWTVRLGEAPGWYGGLRRQLSIAVMLCLGISLAFSGRS
jgi:hypothetical protein